MIPSPIQSHLQAPTNYSTCLKALLLLLNVGRSLLNSFWVWDIEGMRWDAAWLTDGLIGPLACTISHP
jgi:hypothetical protein